MERTKAEKLQLWYQTSQGQVFLESCQHRLIPVLQATFGFHAVQLGAVPSADRLLDYSYVNHKVIANNEGSADVICDFGALPFERDSVDLLFLPHSLEIASDPHQVLREAERVLVPEGRIVIIGVDPWTLSSAWSSIRRKRQPQYSHGRVKDWMELLGLEIEDSHMLSMIGYHRQSWIRGVPKVAGMLNLVESYLAGGYAIVARKRVSRTTRITPAWKPKPRLIAVGLSKQPAARSVRRNRDD